MPSGQRLVSLDAFRGIAIAGMILVNNPGSWSYVYAPLLHAEWHGWTPTDLIFPFFLFIVGVAMTYSIVARLERGADRATILRKVVRRSAILVGLGLLMSGFPRFDITTMRFPGVLQRIGLVYLLASLAVLNTRVRGQAVLTGVLLLGYWALMTLVHAPESGPANLTPDGNLAAYIDRAVFGRHIWQEAWDPEGLLSTIPATATTLSGVLTGHLLRSGRQRIDKTGAMFVLGWGGILLGLAWHQLFPINKSLWTSSYVLFTSGAALHLLGVCYWLIEVKEWNAWAKPAVILGVNAIAAFVLSGLVARVLLLVTVSAGSTSLYGWIYRYLFASWAGPLNGSLAFAVATVLFWYAVMALLYRKRIQIKI